MGMCFPRELPWDWIGFRVLCVCVMTGDGNNNLIQEIQEWEQFEMFSVRIRSNQI